MRAYTLQELQAYFVKRVSARTRRRVKTLHAADGVEFLCPVCFAANGDSSVGTHWVLCWFVGHVPDDEKPGPGRWTPAGSGLDDLTFVPGTPPQAISVQLYSPCNWHGFIRAGRATPS